MSPWDQLVSAHHRAKSETTGPPPRHEPVAAVLACSDARVPPSVIFDQPAGSLFVVRIAGNTASPSALASLDYAVAELGVDLIVVLGHTGCGAVQAAVDGTCRGHLLPVVAPICSIARSTPDATPDRIGELNVAQTVRELADHSGPVGQAATAGRLAIQGAIHDLTSGHLEPLVDCCSSDYLAPNRTLGPTE